MSGAKYHSWETEIDGKRIAIGVSEMPDRKQPCLYVMKGNILTPLAYFRSTEKAMEFLEVFDLFVKASGRYK